MCAPRAAPAARGPTARGPTARGPTACPPPPPQLRQELLQGSPAQALLALDGLVTGFAAKHPKTLFQLRRLQYADLLAAGGTEAALAYARSQLSPLAATCPELVPDLKAALVALTGALRRADRRCDAAGGQGAG